MAAPHTEVEVAEIPPCDFCGETNVVTPAVVDGRTVYGPWANMCERHFRVHGMGKLGLGIGQRLKLRQDTPAARQDRFYGDTTGEFMGR